MSRTRDEKTLQNVAPDAASHDDLQHTQVVRSANIMGDAHADGATTRTSGAPEDTSAPQARNPASHVLAQRVISISSLPPEQPVARTTAPTQPAPHILQITHDLLRHHRAPTLSSRRDAPANVPQDLAATALEWGGADPHQPGLTAQSPTTATPAPGPDSPDCPPTQSPRSTRAHLSESVDAEWATNSAVSLQLCEEAEVWQRILSTTIEDAATLRFNRKPAQQPPQPAPAKAGSTLDELNELDGALSMARRLNGAAFGVNTDNHDVLASALMARAQAAPPRYHRPLWPRRTAPPVHAPARRRLPVPAVWVLISGLGLALLIVAYTIAASLVSRSTTADEAQPRLIPLRPATPTTAQ